jgi:hypothetical protein
MWDTFIYIIISIIIIIVIFFGMVTLYVLLVRTSSRIYNYWVLTIISHMFLHFFRLFYYGKSKEQLFPSHNFMYTGVETIFINYIIRSSYKQRDSDHSKEKTISL